MIRPLAFVLLALPSVLPAQAPPRLGVFPDALYAVQPAIDQILHLSDEQVTKIATRTAPLRGELVELEEKLAAAEPAGRAALAAKIEATRSEIEPAIGRIVEAVLGESQKKLVVLTHDLHASAVRAAAEELARRSNKGQSARLDSLVREQLRRLCPGLDSPELERVESALQGGLAQLAKQSEPVAATAPQKKKQSTGSALLESIATGALQSLAQGESGKPKDLLTGLAEGATKAAAEKLTEALVDKLTKSKRK